MCFMDGACMSLKLFSVSLHGGGLVTCFRFFVFNCSSEFCKSGKPLSRYEFILKEKETGVVTLLWCMILNKYCMECLVYTL